MSNNDKVWFIGPWNQVGYVLRCSEAPGRSDRSKGDGSSHRPPNFPWKSMDRKWSATYGTQGYAAMDYLPGWSVLSVADYTVDSRPNVGVAFAVERSDVPLAEMTVLAAERYPSVWARLAVSEVVSK